MSEREFQLSKDIEHYLAVLSKIYTKAGDRQKLDILVNSQIRVHEEWDYDNWDGGTYGHALFITAPEATYLDSVGRRKQLQNEIKADLNKIHNVPHEFISDVFLETEKVEDRDWRRESGALQSRQRAITPATRQRIWGEDGYRVFLSHKADVKKKAAELKERMQKFGASCFVAHQDIHPTKEWQEEIENALASMDAFVALLTETFHDSLWTDQEVGYALARGVPIIAVKLGIDPYGFIGKFQALASTWDEAPEKVVSLLMTEPRMVDAYIAALPRCANFDEGNTLSHVLPSIRELSNAQADRLMSTFNLDSQLQGSFGFNGRRPWNFGDGLASHLSRLTGQQYVMAENGKIARG
ncbi:MAG TPA: toll/interleukin-1 receptor domain-containing protein [Terriglobia bacterium]|nr:toll/interleukin-1 receptor domain-containing protein [Terriglobia bacterium]